MTKFVFVTGGVVSSLGKGITTASLGRLLKSRGYRVLLQKLDPYLNVDPGTMNPYQHGEVFVTDDGAETDLDLGHYERFLDENLNRECNVTAGSVYHNILQRERRGDYLGGTVQVIPHVTDEIKSRILGLAEKYEPEIQITEIGGTVGDIESLPFLEAIRQLRKDLGKENVFYIHVTLVPFLSSAQELKTKPTQHSVKELRSIGIQPDAIVCRTERPLDESIKKKIALFCDVDYEAVIDLVDVKNIYEVPVNIQQQNLDKLILEKLKLESRQSAMSDWMAMLKKFEKAESEVKIGIVGKYVRLPDAYLSIVEALKHASKEFAAVPKIVWIDAENISEEDVESNLSSVDAILVPGGFGVRGIEGKILAIKYAREKRIPFFGICLGLQCAVIEFARNVAGLLNANSSEFDENTPYAVIDYLPEQKDIDQYGGTMRLGKYECEIYENTIAHRAYGEKLIEERHRHRYEVNNFFLPILEKYGLKVSGINPERGLVEIIELPEDTHPYFLACQFHPEFKSRPTRPHPLFLSFIQAAIKHKKERER
ncbi:MAG: CTP synthase [Actinobacteria bacterium]|nr:CTP synthase [Actinomycetota bacterium]